MSDQEVQGVGAPAPAAGQASIVLDRDFLNSILEGATEYAIVAADLEGNILTWNEGARRIYGYSAEEMVGRENVRVLDTQEETETGRADAMLARTVQTGKAEGVFERVRKSGERFWASTIFTLRRDAAGTPVGVVRITRDITRQKTLEERLRRANQELLVQGRRAREASRLKSEFLANMSHELRTPLNGIIGFAELMHDGRVGPVLPTHKEYLADILESARHLLQLVNDILDLAKVEAGKMEVRPEPLDLARTVREILDILRTQAAGKRIRVETEVAADLGPVVADPAKVKQTLYNYLSNALKFTPEGGRVTVRALPEGADAFRLEVQDTGIGIPAEHRPRLFSEFEQLEHDPPHKYPGTGLGLALTKRLVEAMGGEVGVESTPGIGSRFFAVLPRLVRPLLLKAPALGHPRPARDGAPAVLVIEDDAGERAWLTRVLEEAGYAVETAASGAEAIEQCRRRAFDALTLDLLLPDMSSRDVLQAIQASGANENVPVIVLTVVAERGAVAGYNVHDFLIKPVQPEELVASLRRAGAPPEAREKILVVDDDAAALKVMEATLRHLGYRPLCRRDGVQGLRCLAEEHPAALILDLLMPDMDGFEVLDCLRRTDEGRAIPVIIWTVKELTEEDRARLRASAAGVILKGRGGAELLLEELQKQLGVGRAP